MLTGTCTAARSCGVALLLLALSIAAGRACDGLPQPKALQRAVCCIQQYACTHPMRGRQGCDALRWTPVSLLHHLPADARYCCQVESSEQPAQLPPSSRLLTKDTSRSSAAQPSASL